MFYAGQSNDLRRRLAEHMDQRNSKMRIGLMMCNHTTYFSVASVPRVAVLQVEGILIRMLRPMCNDLISSNSSAIVNLPPMGIVTLSKEVSQ